MKTFYISEILLLPEIITIENEAIDLSVEIQKLVNQYLETKGEFKKIVYFNQELESFKIEMSRELTTEAQYSSSFTGDEKRAIVLLNFETAGDPAQNATLKIIEESPANTLILIPVFNSKNILETIQSRCLIKKDLIKEKKGNKRGSFNWPKNYSQAIEIAEQYKKKNQALNFLKRLLEDESINANKKRRLLTAYQNIDANGNAQLNLEAAFFEKINS